MRRGTAIAPAVACALALVALGGCSDADEDLVVEGSTLTVYAGVPLEGSGAAAGRAVVNGMKLALADADGEAGGLNVVANYLGDTQGDPPRPSLAQAGRNGRRAAQDVRTIGFIGDLSTTTTRVSLPISNQAGIVQITPGATGPELTRDVQGVPTGSPERYYPTGKRTFARVIPDDTVQTAAAARWAAEAGGKRFWVVGGLAKGYGAITGAAFEAAARQQGMRESGKDPIRGGGERTASQVARIVADGRPDVIYFATEDATAGLARVVRAIADRLPGARLFAGDALLDPGFLRRLGPAGRRLRLTSPVLPPSALPAAGRRFAARYRAEFGIRPEPHAAYGYEAMSLLLHSIGAAGKDAVNRSEVARRVLATRERNSILGRYTINGDGDTTLDRVAGYRVRDGRATFARVLRP